MWKIKWKCIILKEMITEYMSAAMRKAKYEILEGDEGFYGEIPGFQGVWANASTLEGCREELAEVLEEWILFHLGDNTPLPKVNGIDLRLKKVRKPALA
jgi:predicted RNase H-like HicB family nuclease